MNLGGSLTSVLFVTELLMKSPNSILTSSHPESRDFMLVFWRRQAISGRRSG
jgi:hypothetical protein